ncbi:MAG: aspartate aminotransferase family protein [Chloroflexi bacterium]|nr:aspartate aminotransferase family protein [Chloroflexota bacterium]MCI0577624.1 aspartate aminotransferase family protein [Chloroflexota bacterium]MCI0644156.1 aspartate aminotransferase family protein [Chloroflexota bacterium]MCI0725261.1 aspartate aminotransferase family protein [Chloroflexota bacterium]
MPHGQKSHEFYERARRVIPYGVNSNFRYWSDDTTPVVARGQDGYVYDFDGKRYIDYRLGFGPIILGHVDPYVIERVIEAIHHGVTFAATHEYEVRVAEHIIATCPGVEMVRLTNTGTECTMHAIRMARGYTGRDIVLKFEGSYHGFQDYLLWSTANGKVEGMGERHKPVAYKQSLGIPEVLRDLVQLCPWNDVEILGDILKEKGEQIAAIIVEPILGNACALMPQPGYLQFLREQCDHYGIVLIFDEVKTGFRIALGGAREYFGVIPDLSTYAKAMGNGYPIAAIGGHRDIMMTIAPGKVAQGGTYTGNAVGTAAADATLEYMRTHDVFGKINHVGTILMKGIDEILSRHAVPHYVFGTPGMFGICLSDRRPRDFRELSEFGDWELYEEIAMHLVDNGVMPDPDGREPWFLCSDHTEADADETLQKYEDAVKHVLAKR